MSDRISNNFFLQIIICGYRWPKSHRAAASSGPLSLSSALVAATDHRKRLHRASGFWLRKKNLFLCTSRLMKRGSTGMFYNFMAKTSAGAELKIGLKISATCRSTTPKFSMSLVIFYFSLEKSITHA